MATSERTHSGGGFGAALLTMAAILVILGIGYAVVWPKVKAAYQAAPATIDIQPTAPPANTGELERLKAQLNAARATQQRPIVQEVPAGEAPQPITVSAPPAPSGNSAPAVEQAPPAPIVIVHQTSSDGAHQTVTGSGACKVSKVAARCGK